MGFLWCQIISPCYSFTIEYAKYIILNIASYAYYNKNIDWNKFEVLSRTDPWTSSTALDSSSAFICGKDLSYKLKITKITSIFWSVIIMTLERKIDTYIEYSEYIIRISFLTLTRPLRRNCEWGGFSTFQRWRSRVFFLNRTSLTPPSDFWCGSFGNHDLFWVRWFLSLSERMRLKKKTMFIHTNQPLIRSFYIKKVSIFAELALTQRWSEIFCATDCPMQSQEF